jgi:predicted nucleic acid-binding protein
VEPATTRSPQAELADQRPCRRAATLIVYFDTSALIKTVLDEEGSELWVLALHAGEIAEHYSLRGYDAVQVVPS